MKPVGASMRKGGFTLMEMLVTLVLVSLATMLMFQMLGSYRASRERVQAQSGSLDRRMLFDGWFRASVHGLFIDKGLGFVGDEAHFAGVSLNPLFAPAGAPIAVEWRLGARDGQAEVAYLEEGRGRWRLSLAGAAEARFAYLDRDGGQHSTWPPKLGKQDDMLPAAVVLVRRGDSGQRAVAAAVLGPLKPTVRLTGEEEY